MERPDLDLTQHHWTRAYGDITAFGTWFGKDRKPALVLVPTAKIGKEGVVPCVVPVTSAWAWAEELGDGAHCARVSAMFAHSLGLGSNVNQIMKVTSVIRDCLGDLLSIPPKPAEAVVVADAVRTDHSTGKTSHSEIVQYV